MGVHDVCCTQNDTLFTSQHVPTQIGARSNGAKNKPVYSALKPVYVVATLLDGPEGLHAAQPTMYKFGATKMLRSRSPVLILQDKVDVRIVEEAKKVFVKQLKAKSHDQEYWVGLRDLCEPFIVARSPPKKTTRSSRRVVTRSTRTRTKHTNPVYNDKEKEKVKSLQQELASTRKELTAAREAAAAAQRSAQLAAAAVESLRTQIPTYPRNIQTPTKKKHKHKKRPIKRPKPSPQTSESPSTSSDSPAPPRWFRKYTQQRQRSLERMRRVLNPNPNPTLNMSPMVLNNMCLAPPRVMSPQMMGFPMVSRGFW